MRNIFLLTSFGAFFLLAFLGAAKAADTECPFGLENDPYPGQCGHYVDQNNDQICDLSQIAQQVQPEPMFQANQQSDVENQEDTSEEINRGNLSPQRERGNSPKGKKYHLISISLLLSLLYLSTLFLSRKKIISLLVHRKIWNWLLLATFFITGLTGIILIIKTNYGIAIPLPFNTLFWHSQIGIAMVVISLFHLAWHWKYYLDLKRIASKQ